MLREPDPTGRPQEPTVNRGSNLGPEPRPMHSEPPKKAGNLDDGQEDPKEATRRSETREKPTQPDLNTK